MRFFILLFFALFCATATAQQATPPNTTTFFPSYHLATEGSQRTMDRHTDANGGKYTIYATGSQRFYVAHCENGLYRVTLNDETTAAK